MNALWKIAGRHICSLILGTAVVSGCGLLMLTDSAFNENAAKTEKTAVAVVKKADSEKTADNADEDESELVEEDNGKTEILSFMNYKKASIGEYNMTAIESGKTEEVVDPDDFTVEFPDDSTVIYQPEKGEAQNLTATRSVEEEYYTVHDEISGNTVTLNGRELVCQMVNSEIGGTWSESAIKAQIVAAYSYIRFNESIGLTPTVGLKSGYNSRIESCFNAVEGQVVMYNGKIINAVYSASTAGYSTSAKNIWGVDYPYLQCIQSDYDDQDPNWDYTKTYTKEQVKKLLEDKFDIELSDDVTNWFKINRVYSVKYVDSVTIDGRSDCTLTGNGLCNLVGLKSNALEISFKDGVFTFKSCGWGHGVGMSQWGAYYYGANGWSYDQILRHYYLNTSVGLSDVCTSAVNRGKEATTTTTTTTAVTESEESQTVSSGTEVKTSKTEKTTASTTTHETETTQPETTTEQPAVTTAPVEEEMPTVVSVEEVEE